MAGTHSKAFAKGRLGTPDTAYIDLPTRLTVISRTFLARLVEAGLTPRQAVRGVLTHEIGHYSEFPWDASTMIYLASVAEGGGDTPSNRLWPESKYGNLYWHIVSYYMDAVDNLQSFLSEGRNQAMAEWQRAMMRITPPDNKMDTLMSALYQTMGKTDLGVQVEGDEALKERLYGVKGRIPGLMNINYFHGRHDIDGHGTSMIMFGQTIQELLTERSRSRRPSSPPPPPLYTDGLEQVVEEEFEHVRREYVYPLLPLKPVLVDHIPNTEPGFDDDEDDESEDGEQGGCLKSPKDMSDAELNDALNNFMNKYVRGDVNRTPRYELIKDFIKRVNPDFKDNFKADPAVHAKLAGIAGAKIQFNPDMIEFYKRLAATYPLYIAPKRMIKDVSNLYPANQVEFSVGDKAHLLNPWSTPFILPGLTTRYEEKAGIKPEVRKEIPDFLGHLDTSGSMASPTERSLAVLATSIMGRTYHANGKLVGLNNFSVDMALLWPTRDIEMFYQLACAYWGGGTVLNTDKLREWVAMRQSMGDRRIRGVDFTTEEDYKKLIGSLSPEERRAFEEKKLTVKVTAELGRVYERLDNVLITDGAIQNIEDVVKWMNTLGEWTRNTIFLVETGPKTKESMDAWAKLGLENTQIEYINSPLDLANVAIGFTKRVMIPNAEPAKK